MRVLCRHGHFAFYPRASSEIGKFVNTYEQELVRVEDFYTFPFLAEAKKYSLQLLPYLGLPALVTFEGQPWDVMRENGFVYSIALGILVPALAIPIIIDPPLIGYTFLAQSPLIQPGSRNKAGQQILSYSGEYEVDLKRLTLSEFSYE